MPRCKAISRFRLSGYEFKFRFAHAASRLYEYTMVISRLRRLVFKIGHVRKFLATYSNKTIDNLVKIA